MNIVTFISNLIIPVLIFYVIGYGLLNKVDIFDAFTRGAADGFKVVFNILPTLIGLMMAIGLLRASGVLEVLGEFLSPYMKYLHFPAELVPISVVKMFSSSAANGLLLDLYKTYGPDSFLGLCASIMMSCTETIFYTMSIYFLHVGIKKTRFTLFGALFSTICGIAASVFIAGLLTT